MRLRYEPINQTLRKSIWVSWERALQNDAGHLPMPGRRVFAIGFQRALAVTAARIRNSRRAIQRTYVAESETLQIRQVQLSRFADVPERI